MTRLLGADFARLRKSLAFRLSLIGMLVLDAFFMVTQATSMDYTVPLSRVIFLPMSLYGIAMAAFVSVFVGTGFSDGFIRNKMLAAIRRTPSSGAWGWPSGCCFCACIPTKCWCRPSIRMGS